MDPRYYPTSVRPVKGRIPSQDPYEYPEQGLHDIPEEPSDLTDDSDKSTLIEKLEPEKNRRYRYYVGFAVVIVILFVVAVLLAIYIPKGTKSGDDHPDTANNPPGSPSINPVNPTNLLDTSTGLPADSSRSGMRDYGLITSSGKAHIGRLNKLFDNNLAEIFPIYS